MVAPESTLEIPPVCSAKFEKFSLLKHENAMMVMKRRMDILVRVKAMLKVLDSLIPLFATTVQSKM